MMVFKSSKSLIYYLNFFADDIHRLINLNLKIADIGCGHGELIHTLVHHFHGKLIHIYGYDSNSEFIDKLKLKIGNVSRWNVCDIPPKKNFFDGVILLDVIEHIDDGEMAIYNIYSMLKSSGILILSTPNWLHWMRFFQGKTWYGYADQSHRRFYTIKKLTTILTKAGFYVDSVYTISESGHYWYDKFISKTLYGGEILLLARKQ